MSDWLQAIAAAKTAADQVLGAEHGLGATVVTLTGATVVTVLDDGSFVYPLVSGPARDHIAGMDPFVRARMAQTLREVADQWEV